MKAALIITFALIAFALCQDFPSSSQTWTSEGPPQKFINITGEEPLKYPNGHLLLAMTIKAGSGMLYYGIGDQKYNYTINEGSSITYEMGAPYCSLDGTVGKIFYVYMETAVDVSYSVTLTQSSTELPNNVSRTVNMIPTLFHGVPFLISTGDKEVTKTISFSVISAVPLDGFMDVAVVEARDKCATEADQLQSFPVVSNSTTWTFTGQFEAGYENYTLTFIPKKIGTTFSSFYVTASVKLGAKPGLGNWLYLILGGAAVVLAVAIIAVVVYVRRPKGYVRIQANY